MNAALHLLDVSLRASRKRTPWRCVSLAVVLSLSSTLLYAEDILDQQKNFEITAQSLDTALLEFSRQADIQVMVDAVTLRGYRTSGVTGTEAAKTALAKLLADSGLIFTVVGNAVQVRPAARAHRQDAAYSESTVPMPRLAQGVDQNAIGRVHSTSASEEQQTSNRASIDSANQQRVEEVVVTGTNIRGVPPSSPVVTITQEEMRLSGQYNAGEALSALPQNFNGQNPGVRADASVNGGGLAAQNLTGSTSANLRGLGPDATLTLLNGNRLPYDGDGLATDASIVPVAAIERVEVLLDGASAVYGSDAIGGVANIILKRDYHGAEVSARYGVATDGGYEQQQYSAIGGRNWGSGGFLITGGFSENTPVRAEQRDYLSYIPRQDSEIYYGHRQLGGLFSGHQALGGETALTFDAFYAERANPNFRQSSSTAVGAQSRDTVIWGMAPGLRLPLPSDWALDLRGAIGKDETEFYSETFRITTGARTSVIDRTYSHDAKSASIGANGSIFDLPGGEARLAVGGGYRSNSYDRFDRIGTGTPLSSRRHSYYTYGEISLPLISESQQVPLVSGFLLTGAARYENYSDSGTVTTPKIGAIWSIAPGFDIKANWGKSFKAPALGDQYQARQAFLFNASDLGVTSPGDTVLILTGGNPNLGPERAEIITAGIVARLDFLPELTIELNWFDIDYVDRVVQPVTPLTQALANPLFAEFVTRDPTTPETDAAIASASDFLNASSGSYDPTSVIAIVDASAANAARQNLSGIDLLVRYSTDVFGGNLRLSSNVSWLDSKRKLTSLSPAQETSGVIYFPADFRGRGSVSWSREGFTFSGHANYIGGVKNTNLLPSPNGDSMTTLDLVVDYQMSSGVLSEAGFTLAIINALDERPPFLQPSVPYYVNYDSTNYSAIGRTVSVTLNKRF